jgi:hypothetical protein
VRKILLGLEILGRQGAGSYLFKKAPVHVKQRKPRAFFSASKCDQIWHLFAIELWKLHSTLARVGQLQPRVRRLNSGAMAGNPNGVNAIEDRYLRALCAVDDCLRQTGLPPHRILMQ